MTAHGTGTRSLFSPAELRFDLQKEFPLVKAKRTGFKTVIKELLWFLNGETNVKPLQAVGCSIWDEWAKPDGELGPVYGYQWRNWDKYTIKYANEVIDHSDGSQTFYQAKVTLEHIDQIAKLIETLIINPDSRRMIVTAWNVADLSDMALEPCHAFAQFYTRFATVDERITYLENDLHLQLTPALGYEPGLRDDETYMHSLLDHLGVPQRCLSSKLYQRSADVFLGVPFNIASYAALTHMIAQVVGMIPKDFIHSFGDAHLYSNHYDKTELMLSRPIIESGAKLKLNKNVTDIFEFKLDDFILENYVSHPSISADVAV